MAIRDASAAHFLFEVGAFAPEDLMVADFRGREAISQPYRFELRLVSSDPDVASEDVLNKPASFTLLRGDTEEKIHGVIVDFEAGERADPERVVYHAVLAPRLQLLALTQQSRVFQNKSVQEIVTEVLKGGGLTGSAVKWSLAKKSPPKEYVVQYQETDLNFVSRLLEHEGIFYWFDHAGEEEVLVISDDPKKFPALADPEELSYRPPGAMAGDVPEHVDAFSTRERVVTKKVMLRDYNYRTPEVNLQGESQISDKGVGLFYEYGDHFKNVDEGNQLARVRNEEIDCMRLVGQGASDCRGLRAGHRFTLKEHFRNASNREFVLLEVIHQGSQARAMNLEASGDEPTYANEFTCIPSDAPYRPPRLAPKPRVDGSMHAVVDASGSGQYAEIDDQGRYKVRLPFDLAQAKAGQASKAMRMAQPYSGADYGMHFPLHKGTEVILTHVDGDLDRPIIAASVPNPATGTPVKSGNKSQCMIRTGGNNQIQLEDNDGSQRITMTTPSEGTMFSMGAPNSPGAGFDMKTDANIHSDIGVDATYKIGGNVDWTIAKNAMRKVLGFCEDKITGSWRKTINGDFQSFIVGLDSKQVLGANTETYGGLQHETVMGAIVQLGYAMKLEKQGGPSFFKNPVTDIDAKTLIKMNAGAKLDAKAPLVHIDGTSGAALVSGSADRIEVTPGDISLFSDNIQITGKSKITLKVGGSTITMTSGRIEIKSSEVHVVGSSGRVNVTGDVSVTASDIYLKGKVTEV
jgi:type VI secretion system secreted protein VgrG